jgi:transposase-like protein
MLKEAYQKILYGTEPEAKKAWQSMRKLVYSGGHGKYDEIKEELENVKENYKNIVEDWRREYYISSISIMYFLHHKESDPNFFLPFLLGLLENFWSYSKKRLAKFNGVSRKTFYLHLKESEFRYNNKSDILMLLTQIGKSLLV